MLSLGLRCRVQITRGAATAKEKRKPVDSQFIAVSDVLKYVAADVETGAKVSHYSLLVYIGYRVGEKVDVRPN